MSAAMLTDAQARGDRSTSTCGTARWRPSPTTCATGLSRQPKELPPKYFYDERGSHLFEQITRLPEYYPTRAEQEILDRVGDEIVAERGARGAGRAGPGLGSQDECAAGSDGRRRRRSITYVPVDVSESAVREPAAPARRHLRGSSRSTASWATSSRTSIACDRTAAGGWSPSSAARSATSTVSSGSRFLRADATTARPRRPAADRHRPRQGHASGSRPPTTTPPA